LLKPKVSELKSPHQSQIERKKPKFSTKKSQNINMLHKLSTKPKKSLIKLSQVERNPS